MDNPIGFDTTERGRDLPTVLNEHGQNSVLTFLGNLPKKATILDLGTGEGNVTGELQDYLQEEGYGEHIVRGIDFRPSSNGKNVAGSFTSLPFKDATFQRVVSTFAFGTYAESQEEFIKQLSELNRVMEIEGRVLFNISLDGNTQEEIKTADIEGNYDNLLMTLDKVSTLHLKPTTFTPEYVVQIPLSILVENGFKIVSVEFPQVLQDDEKFLKKASIVIEKIRNSY